MPSAERAVCAARTTALAEKRKKTHRGTKGHPKRALGAPAARAALLRAELVVPFSADPVRPFTALAEALARQLRGAREHEAAEVLAAAGEAERAPPSPFDSADEGHLPGPG